MKTLQSLSEADLLIGRQAVADLILDTCTGCGKEFENGMLTDVMGEYLCPDCIEAGERLVQDRLTTDRIFSARPISINFNLR